MTPYAALALVAVLIAACGKSAPPGASTPDLAGPTPDLAGPTLTISGTVTDYGTGAGLGEMAICVNGTNVCTQSIAGGAYVLPGVPAGAQVLLDYSLAGYRTKRTETTTPDAPLAISWSFYSLAEASAAAQAVGQTFDDSKPSVAINVYDTGGQPLSGATAALAGGAGCAGPFYYDDVGSPAPRQNSTGATGLIVWWNCASTGTWDLAVTHKGQSCPHTRGGWVGNGPGTIATELFADVATDLGATCAN